jgi:hypothetical protein
MLRFLKMVNILTQYSWIVFLIWLSALTFFFFRYIRHYKILTQKKVTQKDLKELLEEYSKDVTLAHKNLEQLDARLSELEEQSLGHIQKYAVVRFNPFGEVGGDQSFATAVLDKDGNGLVISSLHGRDNTRVYGKPVEEGRAVGYEFSAEEAQVVKKALEN